MALHFMIHLDLLATHSKHSYHHRGAFPRFGKGVREGAGELFILPQSSFIKE